MPSLIPPGSVALRQLPADRATVASEGHTRSSRLLETPAGRTKPKPWGERVRRTFASLLVAIVLTVMFASIGPAGARTSPCTKYQERAGCVLKSARYLGHSQGAVVSFNTSPSGSDFIFHVHGRCLDAAVEVKQKLKIGASIKIQTDNRNETSGPLAASLKVVSAKKGTATVTESNPQYGPSGCNQTVTVPLNRVHAG